MWTLIGSLLSALIGPLLTMFQRKQVQKADVQASINQAKAESRSEVITDAGHVRIQAAREASDSLVADVDHAGLRQQSDDIAQAIAAADSELRSK